MLCCNALNLTYYAQENKTCAQSVVLFIYKFAWISHHIIIVDNFRKTVLLECILWIVSVYILNTDCSIRVYWSFAVIFHKCEYFHKYILHISYYTDIILNGLTNYVQNYAGIIGGSLTAAIALHL